MLEALTVERERHDRHRNLVVAATGTGKTVVAALDYRQLVEQRGRDLSLLFVAHREEILRQSLATYRAVLRDGVVRRDSRRGPGRAGTARLRDDPVAARCASGEIAPDTFDVVVVDEFHHAAAATYDRLLNHLAPEELLGPDRDARAPRRQGRHGVVRSADRGRAAALGGDRPGLPRAVPVLRRRRRDRSEPSHLAARRLRHSRSSATSSPTTTSRREAARSDPADRVRSRLDARARLLRLEGARALHGAQVHRGRPRERRAHRRRPAG